MKSVKKILALVLNLALVLSSVVFSMPLTANAAPVKPTEKVLKDGEAQIIKTAEPVKGEVNKWKVTVRAEYNPVRKPTDVLVVLDRSGSMADGERDANGVVRENVPVDEQRMTNAKIGIQELTNRVLAQNKENKVALYSYSYGFANNRFYESLTKHTGFTQNPEDIKNALTPIQPQGGTFTQMALHEADKAMSELKKQDVDGKRNRVVVLVTDGKPTVGYKVDIAKLSKEEGGLGNFFEWRTNIQSTSDYPQYYNDAVQNASDGRTTSATNYVQNGKYYKVGYGVSQFGSAFASRDAYVSNGKIPASTFIYSDGNPNTQEGRSNILNRIGWGCDIQYAMYGIDNQGRYMYWDIPENTVVEANAIKEAGNINDLYVVGLVTNDETNSYLKRMASPNKFYPSSSKNFQKTINSILDQIKGDISIDESLKDVIGDEFSEPTEIKTTKGEAKYVKSADGTDNGHIDWNIGKPTMVKDENVPEADKVYYEELSYVLTMKDGWEKTGNKTFKTNGKTEVTVVEKFKEEEINNTTAEAISPEVDPVKLTVAKELKGVDGANPAFPDENFEITISGPDGSNYAKTVNLKKDGNVAIGDLKLPGTYKITEAGNYDKKFKITAIDTTTGNETTVEADSFVVNGDGSVKISGGKDIASYVENDIKIVITNTEKKVKIGDYVWNDANNDGIQDNTEKPLKDVTVKLLDKEGKPAKDKDGKAITTTTDAAGKYLFEVAPGEYKVEIVVPDGYAMSNNQKSTSENVTLKSGDSDLKKDFGLIKSKTYKVTHEFKVAKDSSIKEFPEAVKTEVAKQLPDEQTGKKNGEVVKPGTLNDAKDVEDKANDGKWKFTKFIDQDKTTDEVDAKVDNADVNFVGEWTFVPNKHNVTYEYKSGTKGMELPDALKKKAPSPVTAKVKGDKVTSPVPQGQDATFRDEANKGTWKFKEYDRGEVTIDNKDEHVVGTWVFEKDPEPATYKVTHEFKVAKDSSIKEFPEAVKTEVAKQLPDEQTGKKNGEVVKPGTLKDAKDVEDKANDGKWKFTKFIDQDKTTDEVDAKVDNADVNFVGEWTFVPNKHNVTYEYKSGTKGMELPDALKKKAPEDAKDKVKGDKVTSPVPQGADATFRDEANKGTWKFKEYDRGEVTIDNKDEHVIGTWIFEKDPEPKTYKVTHEFTVAKDSSIKEFPEAVKTEVAKQLPEEQTGKKNGEVVKPGSLKEAKDVEDKANDGKWKFTKFIDQDKTTDEVDAKVDNADVNFVGEWTFVPNKHKVTYEYKSGTKGMELPDALKKKAPEAAKDKVKGDKVTSPVPQGQDATFRDEANKGTWKFKEYDRGEVTIDNKDEHVIGTWVFEKDPEPKTYKVTHEFKSADPNKELPDEVKKLLPSNQTGKKDGSKVNPTAPAKTTVETKDGIWTFVGYDKAEKTVEGKDVEFIGKWKFTPKTYKVTHEFKVAKDSSIKEFPEAVKTEVAKQLPDEQTGKKNGEVVKPGTLKDAKDVEDKANDGKWKFTKFIDQDKTTDEVDAKVDNADVNFVGEWTFVPNKHNVTYEYKSATKGMELPDALKKKAPSPVTDKVKGDKVTSPVPTGADATFRDEANKGTWKFKEYDRGEVTIDNKDEHVIGTWVFEKDPEPATYKVTHKFESEDPNIELPEAVKKLIPSDQTGKKDGSKVTPTEPNTKKVETNEGTWTFTGYDKAEKTVEGRDVEFIGKWKFTPKTYKVTHEFKVAKDSSIKEFPEAVKTEVAKQLPDEQTGKKNGEVVKPGTLNDAKDVEDKANDGKWKFTKFIDQDKTTDEVDAKVDNADVNFVGEWTFVPNKHNVTYEYKSGTAGMELPDALKKKAPEAAKDKVKGDKITSPVPQGADATFRDEANKGTWKFKEYDKSEVTIDNKDEHVVGIWVFEKDPEPKTYKVTHEFKVAEDSSIKEFPEAVKSEVAKQLPDEQTGKKNGEVVKPGTLKDAKDVEDKANDGKWKFTKFIDQDKTTDEVDARVDNADVDFVGEWTFVPNKHNVTYEYKSGTKGMELPDALKKKAPEAAKDKVKGDKITSPVPQGADATFRDEANKGTWKFKEYDKSEVTIDNKDEHVIGTWAFEKDPEPKTYKVTHEFKSDDPNKELPDEVKKLLPSNQTGKKDGSKVNPTAPAKTTVETKDGIWTFVGYDKAEKTIDGKDAHFVGTWEFTPKKVEFDTKQKNSKNTSPNTGDTDFATLELMMILLGMAASVGVLIRAKRHIND